MPHGRGLQGFAYLAQGALALPVPRQEHQYYLFTLQSGYDTPAMLSYSRIDLQLNAGLGDVVEVEKNLPVAGALNRQLTAIPHTNGQDYWLITRRWNSNVFLIYQVNAQEITLAHTLSLGPSQTADLGNGDGYLMPSPNGQKLAYAVGGRFSLSLFDFDAATGLLSNYVDLGPSLDAGGVSFSPDNTKLYVGSFDVVDQARRLRAILLQFDVAAGNAAAIRASRMSIIADNPTTNIRADEQGVETFYALQLGLDGRLYGNSGYTDKFLPLREGQRYMYVINYPNRRGFACQVWAQPFAFASQEIGAGFPNFLQSYFNGLEPPADEQGRCENFSLTLFPNPTTSAVQLQVPTACFHPYQVTLYNSIGQCLYRENILTALSNPIDLGNFAAGIYYFQARFSDRILTTKVLKN